MQQVVFYALFFVFTPHRDERENGYKTITAVSQYQSKHIYAWVGSKSYLIPFILQHKLLPWLLVTILHLLLVNQLLSCLRPAEHPLYLSAAPIDFSGGMTLLVTWLGPCWGHLRLFPVWTGSRAAPCLCRAPGELSLARDLAKIIMHLQV